MDRINRRTVWQSAIALALMAAPQAQAKGKTPLPVIFHTDIGGDVDDTWALLLLMRRPELDLKLVVTEGENAVYRGRLTAKLLTLGKCAHVPLAIGADAHDDRAAQSDWIGDFTLKDYAGTVRTDGAQAIVDVIMASDGPVTIISVGPATTVSDALRLEPAIAKHARFVGMFGSIHTGYGAGKPPEAEYNVKTDPTALRNVFEAAWPCSITPLDTCGLLTLDGPLYQQVRRSHDPFAIACIRNSELWLPHASWMAKDFNIQKTSSILFDVVAVVMAFDESDLIMQTLPLSVLDDGMTVVDPINGKPVRCALAWKNMPRFKRRVVANLTKNLI